MTSVFAPRVFPRIINTVIPLASSVETTAISFARVCGSSTIQVEDADTGFTFSFSVLGGLNSNSHGYPMYDASAQFQYLVGSEINCTPSFNLDGFNRPLADGIIYITTTEPRTYTFTFNPTPGIKPTIIKTGGAALTGNLNVKVNFTYVGQGIFW